MLVSWGARQELPNGSGIGSLASQRVNKEALQLAVAQVLRAAAQRALERCVDVATQRSLQAREAADDDTVETLQLEAFDKNRIMAALGPPGIGKTLVVNRCVRRWQTRSARILFALPTGEL
ncbi:MAG: hypothetical protein NXI12_15405 [Alphaproteobacteria bacterium]|nr:hypothetical protein [Alphaproteobacteria bacterium]